MGRTSRRTLPAPSGAVSMVGSMSKALLQRLELVGAGKVSGNVRHNRMKSRLILLIAGLSVCLTSCTGPTAADKLASIPYEIPPLLSDIPESLQHWMVLPRPTNEIQHSAMNYSDYAWAVSLSGGDVHATWWSEINQLKTNSVTFQVPDSSRQVGMVIPIPVHNGWLVGFNAGEFGASVWWFSKNKKQHYKISDDQVVAFVPTGTGLLVLEGLAHLGISRGRVMRPVWDEAKERWSLEEFATLPEAPDAGTLWRDLLLVVTTTQLVTVDLSGNVKVLIKDVFWSEGYPTSIVVDNQDTAFVGMREGVARIDLQAVPSRVDWLVPNMRVLNEDIESVERTRR